ncbi:hypothetical protein EGT74_07915 [Chitinophaga lutea]|uniref:Uncharacterized protein n=1 Tax=Chitinophaga lutea TaxID=2488634 RepID=A0A3N4QP35_9BACT|nr:hypothetical protein EGT74_07915 [Chitinophaga lutea]
MGGHFFSVINQNVKTVIVYASSPIQRVIGEFEIDEIINCRLDDLWNTTQQFSGISRQFFDQYFADKELGYAIKIKSAKRYKYPKCLKTDFNLLPPQSFAYC